jgi:hypothetical protein
MQRATASDPWVTVETPRCFVCGQTATLEVPAAGFDAWRAGALIQRALPGLSSPERELLISGTHPACWDRMMGEED